MNGSKQTNTSRKMSFSEVLLTDPKSPLKKKKKLFIREK